MKGDFTRSTWRPEKHYSGVRMQQGRVQLDSDWNESVDIATHRTETGTLDVVGQSGAPLNGAGFALVLSGAAGDDFLISAGRYYVEGVLCENESPVTYRKQPDYRGETLSSTGGTYLAYLDVWLRHLTAIEDPEIRETALGGPDTATRTKVVWQVKLVAVDASDANGTGALPASLIETSSGRLSARDVPATEESDPCLIAPGAGYRRGENQLYRVEIHDRGVPGDATFKWSRDNGSVATAVTRVSQAGKQLTLAISGSNRSMGFAPGDCLELTDDSHDLSGEPGQLLTLMQVNGQMLTVEPREASDAIDFAEYPSRPQVRKWDGLGSVALVASNEGYIELESGVQVKFESGFYRSGDYWLVPARSAVGHIEWPFEEPQPPLGISHRYCRLAVLEFDGKQFTSVRDCRSFFPAATELTSLFYLGGDGQESGPGQLVPQPLRAGVANGTRPVVGAVVRFAVTAGAGTLQGSPDPVVVTTDAAGVAVCAWKLDSTTPNQQVEATLLDMAGNVRHLPVRFNASFTADARDSGFHVKEIALGNGNPLANDKEVRVVGFTSGVDVVCDVNVDPTTINRGSFILAAELPYPASAAEKALWGNDLLGFQALTLAGSVVVNKNTITWKPSRAVEEWLQTRLFQYLRTNQLEPRIMVRLTLRGDFIRQSGKPDVHLDGDLNMWFWLVV